MKNPGFPIRPAWAAMCSLALVLCLFPSPSASDQDGYKMLAPLTVLENGVPVLSEGVVSMVLTPYIEVLEDPGGELLVQDVANSRGAHEFVSFNGEQNKPLARGGARWFRLRLDLKPTGNWRDWILIIHTGYFAHPLEIYIPECLDAQGSPSSEWRAIPPESCLYRSNWLMILSLRELAVPATAHGADSLLALMRSETEYIPDFQIVEQQRFMIILAQWASVDGFFYGILMALALLNLFAFLQMRDKSLFWFFLLIVSLANYFLQDDNFLRLHTTVTPLFFTASSSLMVFLAAMFTRSYLLTKKNAPLADKCILAYALFALASIPAPILHSMDLYEDLLHVMGLLSPVVMLGSGFLCWYKGFKPAKLFLVGVAAFPLGAVVQILADKNNLPQGSLCYHALRAGCAIMAILISLALVNRLRLMREAKRQAEKARDESERRFRAVFDQTFEFMGLLDPGGRFLEINNTALESLGLKKETILGKHFWDESLWRGPDLDKEVLRGQVERAARGELARFQIRGKLSGEGERHLDFSLKPVRGEDGGVALIIGEARDVTELKQAQEQVFFAEKMSALGRLVAGVAHEVNNPNNFIYFNLPVLRQYLEEIRAMLDGQAREHGPLFLMGLPQDQFFKDVFQLLADMEHGSSRITGIVSQLRDYVAGQDPEPRRAEEISNVIEHALALAGKQVEKMVTSLEVHVEDNLPPVLMNAGKMEQVFINLLLNAAQAADKEDSRIILTARRDGPDAVAVTVEDNGRGVPGEHAEKIFEPFFTSRGKDAGTGQGLAISRKIIEDHGGSITFSSTPGHGAAFTITLPVYKG